MKIEKLRRGLLGLLAAVLPFAQPHLSLIVLTSTSASQINAARDSPDTLQVDLCSLSQN